MIATTSKIAYKEINEEGTMKTQRDKILYVVKSHCDRVENIFNGISLREISSLTGFDINAVSGRVNGLKKDGFLKTIEKRKCSVTKRLVSPVIPINSDDKNAELVKDSIYHMEDKIKLLLMIKGYKEIKFTSSLDGTRVLRIGYYKPIKKKDVDYCHLHGDLFLSEVSAWDDDCGEKYWYLVNEQ